MGIERHTLDTGHTATLAGALVAAGALRLRRTLLTYHVVPLFIEPRSHGRTKASGRMKAETDAPDLPRGSWTLPRTYVPWAREVLSHAWLRQAVPLIRNMVSQGMAARVLVLSLLIVQSISCCFGSPLSRSVPAFIWSDKSYVKTAESTDGALVTSTKFSEGLFRSLLHTGLDAQSMWPFSDGNDKPTALPSVIFVYIGKQIGDILPTKSGEGRSDPLAVLKKTFASSKASLEIPNVELDDADQSVPLTLLRSYLKAASAGADGASSSAGAVAVLGPCGQESALFMDEVQLQRLSAMADLQDFLVDRQAEGSPEKTTSFVLVCSADPDNELPSVDALEDEVAELNAYLSTIQSFHPHFLAVYMSDPVVMRQQDEQLHVAQRRLLTKYYNSTHCDEDCQYKASLLEGLGVVVVLLVILISGLCCMAGVEGPGKFELPKEN